MDEAGVATAITSITAPGLDFVDGRRLVRLNRECNEYERPHGGGSPATLRPLRLAPAPDVDASLAEIAYALDVLKADGVGFLTSYRDRWLAIRRSRR